MRERTCWIEERGEKQHFDSLELILHLSGGRSRSSPASFQSPCVKPPTIPKNERQPMEAAPTFIRSSTLIKYVCPGVIEPGDVHGLWSSSHIHLKEWVAAVQSWGGASPRGRRELPLEATVKSTLWGLEEEFKAQSHTYEASWQHTSLYTPPWAFGPRISKVGSPEWQFEYLLQDCSEGFP